MNYMLFSTVRFVALTLIALCALGAALFVYASIRSAEERSASVRGELQSSFEAEVLARSLSRMFAETEEVRKELMTFVVGGEAIAEFIGGMEKLGASLGVTIEVGSIQLSEENIPPPLQDMLISLKIEGPWEKVFRYIRTVESIPGTTVGELTLDATGRKGVWTGVLSVRALSTRTPQ